MLVWIEKNRNLFYCSILFVIAYIFLILLSLRPPLANDSYWHLQMGLDLLEKNLSPLTDHYSFTHLGAEIKGVPVIFQVILASYVKLFGMEDGFFYITLTYLSFMMFFLFVFFKQIKAPWFVVFLILPVIIYFIDLRILIRPELISNILTIICLILYCRAKKSFTNRELSYIALLLLFWVNYHSPIFGYIIIFGLFLDKAFHKIMHTDDSFSWAKWCTWGVVIFLIGFVNVSGEHFLIAMITFLGSDIGTYTREFNPSYQMYAMNEVVYLLWGLSIYLLVFSIFKKEYGCAVIVLLLTYFSWSMARLVSPVAIINFCIFSIYLSQISFSSLKSVLRPKVRNSLLSVSVFLTLFVLYVLTQKMLINYENRNSGDIFLSKKFPIQASEYLKQNKDGGNILNLMDYGGYLLYRLSPKFKVYIDGRTNILYSAKFLKYNIGLYLKPSMMKRELENHSIQYVLHKNIPDNLLNFQSVKNFTLNFADENFMIFSNDNVNSFPVISKLVVFPMCWNEALIPEIKNEFLLAEKIMLDDSFTIKSNLSLVQSFSNDNDKQHFFREFQGDTSVSNNRRRLVMYMAFQSKNYEIALNLFSQISDRKFFDYIMLAHAIAEENHFFHSKEIMDYFKEIADLTKDEAEVLEEMMNIAHNSADDALVLDLDESDAVDEGEDGDQVDNESRIPSKIILAYKGACNKLF